MEILVGANQFEVGAIRCDEPCTKSSRGQSYKNVEVQVTEFAPLEAVIALDLAENLTRFQPTAFSRRKSGIPSFQGPKDNLLSACCSAAPELCQDDSGIAHKIVERVDAFGVAIGAELVDED